VVASDYAKRKGMILTDEKLKAIVDQCRGGYSFIYSRIGDWKEFIEGVTECEMARA